MRLPSRPAFVRKTAAVLLIALIAVLFPGGCAVIKDPDRIEDLEEPPQIGQTKYVIQNGDELDVRFFHTPEMNLTLPVRPDGFISLPYVQEVQAAGKTPADLSRELIQAYGGVLRDPEVTVIVRTFSLQQIHVGGRVENPGVFPLGRSLTVLQAIFEAGGYQPEARLSEVVLIRKKPDSSYRVLSLNLNRVLDGTDLRQNLMLHPFDVIYVPDSPIAHVNTFVDLYIRKNIPIQFGIRPDIVW